MLNLLSSTLIMMGLTFIIGFFVAGVIKIIANWADLINFIQLHREDITDLKKTQKSLLEARILYAIHRKHIKYIRTVHRLHGSLDDLKSGKRITA